MNIKSPLKRKLTVNEQAKDILRLLIEEAPAPHRWITYGELSRRTGIANCALRVPMDRLSATISKYAASTETPVPPIQIMVVNSKTGVPGPGASRHIGEPYLRGVPYDKLTLAEQKRVVDRIRHDIASYSGWKSIERGLVL